VSLRKEHAENVSKGRAELPVYEVPVVDTQKQPCCVGTWHTRHEKTTAGTSVFVLKTMFSTQACFLRKNGLFFDLRALELRVEEKKNKKKYTRDTATQPNNSALLACQHAHVRTCRSPAWCRTWDFL
jgi:hypothetical protein